MEAGDGGAGNGGAGDCGAGDDGAGSNGNECKYGQFVYIGHYQKSKEKEDKN